MLLFGSAVSVIGKVVSENVAKQMSIDFDVFWRNAVEQKLIDDNLSEIAEEHTKIFRMIGENYKILDRDAKFIMNSESIDLGPLLNEKKIHERKASFYYMMFVDYEVLKGNEVIYSSIDDYVKHEFIIKGFTTNKIMNLMSTYVEKALKPQDTTTSLTLKVRINPFLILMGYAIILFVGIIIFFITHFIGRVLARAFTGILVKPLNDLEFRLNTLAEGNIEVAMNSEIVLKRPIREVENLAKSTNKIISKMSEYFSLMENHKEELEAQNIALEENSATLTSMNADIESKHSKLRNILNHMEQGFITFNKELYIDEEYSLECERIFGKGISHNRLSDLLYPEDKGMQKFVNELIIKIFSSSSSQRKLYLSLLPEEVLIKGKNISITYKIVTNESNEEIFMVIFSDITEKRKLEKRMDEEKNRLKMVVKAMISRNEFLQLVNEYKQFTKEEFQAIASNEIDDILRNVHNFKGNFSQFDMINIVGKLDELENRLYENNSCFEVYNLDGSEMRSWLDEDIETIEAYVGTEFIREEETFYIKKSKLLEIEEKLKLVLPSKECKTVLPIIKSLGYKSMKDILKNYPTYVQKLSERLGKSINLMQITGDDVLVDTNYYRDLSKVLVHIVRNCVDHGIENEDERLENDKEQLGNITCNIEEGSETLRIIIGDDGKGIDVEALEKKSIEQGFYKEEQIAAMTRQQRLNLIFEQGISTKENATTISGRGVGMAAVKACIQHMGGNIKVESEKHRYTRFIITVPRFQEIAEKGVTATEFMEAMVEVTANIIVEHTGLNMKQGEIKEKNIIELNKVTSLINLKGSINSIIMVSANDTMAIKLVEGFILEKLSDEEKVIYAEDVIGEVCNNILGNTFGLFDDNYNTFYMGIPAMISNNGAYVKYTNSQILTASLEYENYKISISMLILQNEGQEVVKEDLVWQEY
jgi:signal transduction histidine kinase/CheY-specific phosphatase CheX